MDLDWGFKGSGKSGNALARELGGHSPSASTLPAPVLQPVVHHGVAPGPAPLPLEDAKELGKLLRKVDEAMRAMAKMSVDAETVTVALPHYALGKRQGENH